MFLNPCRSTCLPALLTAVIVTSFATAAHADLFTPIAPLGTNNTSTSLHVTGISNSGLVVGYSTISGHSATPFSYDYNSKTSTNLGSQIASYTSASGSAISNSGSYVAAYASHTAYLFGPGSTLQTLPISGTVLNISSINNSGVAVAQGLTSSFSVANYYIKNGTTTNFPAYQSTATTMTSINNNGVIAGYANLTTSFNVVTFDTATSSYSTVGSLPSNVTAVNGVFINDSSTLAGTSLSADDNALHAWIYTSGSYAQLPSLITGGATIATGLNASGDIVGYAQTSAGSYDPVLWTPGTSAPIDLAVFLAANADPASLAGWSTAQAASVASGAILRINDNGLIAGNGTLNSVAEGFIIDAGTLVAVPEPLSATLLLPVALLTLRRRNATRAH